MTNEAVLKDVEEIFQDIFDDESLTITEETTATDVAGWDSLNHVNLISAIEKQYKIRFALGELASMKNVGEMVKLIVEKTS